MENFCGGVLQFFGPHAKDGFDRCGVALDEPIGINNGTAGGHKVILMPHFRFNSPHCLNFVLIGHFSTLSALCNTESSAIRD